MIYKVLQVVLLLMATYGVFKNDYALAAFFISTATYILFYSVAAQVEEE